ncbi:MAG: DUF4982 domain-containing protein [Rikenellaceae bacterium]
MTHRDSIDWGRADIGKLYLKILMPTLLSMVSGILVTIADGFFVGRYVGSDYLGETRVTPQRGWQVAMLDVNCNPRQEGLLFECCWNEAPKVKLAVAGGEQEIEKYIYEHGITYTAVLNKNPELIYTRSWNWTKGEDVVVNIYSNCDEVNLKVNGRFMGRRKVDLDKYYVAYKLPYKAGKIEAYGYRDGKLVTKDMLKTSAMASEIKANVIHSTIKADSHDVSIIEVEVTDKNGVLNPTSTDNVKVEVSGSAKFIGMDSGNLFYEGNFKEQNRNAHEGRLLIYVQSNGKVGDATVTLTSDSLATETVTIKAIK